MQFRRSSPACLALVAVLLGACAPQPPAPPGPARPAPAQEAAAPALPAELLDVDWGWVGMTTPVEDVNVHVPDKYTIRFRSGERIEVRADCNRGSASYSIGADRRIEIGPVALTRMACPPGSLSDRFARELGRVGSYFVQDGELHLELSVDSGTLRFRRL